MWTSRGKLAEAKQEADALVPQEWRKAEEAKLAEAVKAADTRLDSWKADADSVATKATQAQEVALTERVTSVETDVTALLERLRGQLSA